MEEQSFRADDNADDVIRRYSDMVYRLAFAWAGNSFDADEIYQEVFLRYIRRKPVFRDEEHRKAWLLRKAREEDHADSNRKRKNYQ